MLPNEFQIWSSIRFSPDGKGLVEAQDPQYDEISANMISKPFIQNISNVILSQKSIEQIIVLVREVGKEIITIFNQASFTIERKKDNSPVTIADRLASKMIYEGLGQIASNIPVVCEEMDEEANLEIINYHPLYWLVDPIDGTASFIRHEETFTINIALIERGVAKFGIVYQPLTDMLYYTAYDNVAHKIEKGIDQIIHVNRRIDQEKGLDVLVSTRGMSKDAEKFTKALKIKSITQVSSSLKFCLIAEGKFDLYANFSRMCIWDTAAGNAVLTSAGGIITHRNGNRLLYDNGASLESPKFVAYSSAVGENYIKQKLANLDS